MIPVVNTAVTIAPAQTTLVATPLPETSALRVPFDNVPPPVSNAQINNNARGNGAFVSVEPADYAIPVAASARASASVAAQATVSASVSAPFIAQLVSQQVPVALQSTLGGVLAQYEQMIANSYIKYRPSNASLPPPPPSGAYAKVLQQQAPRVAFTQPAVTHKQQSVERIEPIVLEHAPVVRETPEPQPIEHVEAPIVVETQPRQEPVKQDAPAPLSVSAASAYAKSASRVQTTAPANIKASA